MADISVKLNGDNSNFKRMMDDSSQAAGTIAGQIAKKFELKDIGKTMATALGLNIQNMAEQVARFFTGMTKEEEEAYKKLEQLSTQAADASIKNMRAMLTEEQRYISAIQDRDRLQREVASFVVKTGADQETLYKKQIQLQERIGETLAYEKKQRDEIAKANEAADKQAISYAEKKFQSELQNLEAVKRIEILKQSISQLETVIASGVLDTKNKQDLLNVSSERKILLLKEEEELRKVEEKNIDAILQGEQKANDIAREKLGLNEQRASISVEIAKLEDEIGEGLEQNLDVTSKLKRVDELRGELKAIEKKETENNVEIAKLLLKGADNLTEAEKQRLKVLQGVAKQSEINLEIAQITARAVNGELTPADKARLAVLIEQSAQLSGQVKTVKEMAGIVAKFSVGRENVTELSNTQLAALQTKAMQQLSRAEQKQAASGSIYSIEKNEAADYLNQIMGEINLRKQFSATANFEGGKYNERNYDVSTFERLKQLINPDLAIKQQNDISDISKNLRTLLGG